MGSAIDIITTHRRRHQHPQYVMLVHMKQAPEKQDENQRGMGEKGCLFFMFGTYQLLLVFIQNEKNVFAFIFIGNTFKCFYEKYNLYSREKQQLEYLGWGGRTKNFISYSGIRDGKASAIAHIGAIAFHRP